jgi:probable rRNA maturation factor
MSIDLELQIASTAKTLPHPAQVREWVSAALLGSVDTAEMTIRIVDIEEISELNYRYRKKLGPTNVLSFPYNPIPGIASRLLGDVVVCAPLVEKEALEQNIPLLDHWAHLIIHGILHLLGYDHEFEDDAEEMESKETEILVQLGFQPPYGEKA